MKKWLLLAFCWYGAQAHAMPSSQVVLVTTEGEVTLGFFKNTAHKTAEQFLKLVRLGIYDHTAFTYAEPGYYLQVGTVTDRAYPLTVEQRNAIHPLEPEFSKIKHDKGMVTMSLAGDDPATAATAVTVMMGPAPHMDGKSTIFAKVEKGMEVLERMERLARDGENHFLKRVEIIRAVTDGMPDRTGELALEQTQIRFAIEALALILLVTLASFFLRKRYSDRVIAALNLVVTFIAAFGLFLLGTPMARQMPLVGAVIFVGMVAFYKLMNRFEAV